MAPKITPHLWFDTQAKEAAEFYVSVFSKRGPAKVVSTSTIDNTPSGEVDIVTFELLGQQFMAISAGPLFKFNEAVSFIINCETQEEIDYYWGQLSAHRESEQCGWLKDKFGLSWQVVPTAMNEMMGTTDKAALARVTKAFLQMKKFDIKELESAYKGN